MKLLILALTLAGSLFAFAEEGTYGSIYLSGMARDSWSLNPPGPANAMVCNVNGPDGFLSVRSCASTDCPIVRSLKRLAILQLDTRYRNGHWVFVTGAYRSHSPDGDRLAETKILAVRGWAHDGYLCDFLD
jgi:hypothetical protein